MYEDQPPFGADDKCRALYFGSHPLGRSVLGTAESIGDLPVEAMRDYFRRRYSPGNIVLAARGPDRFRRAGGRGRAVLRRLGAGRRRAATLEPAARRDGFQVLHKEIGHAAVRAAAGRRPGRRRRRPLRRQAAGHRARRRLGQPALLGTGRSGPGRTRQPQPLRVPGRRHDDDLHELRARAGGRQSAADPRRLPPAPRPRASRRPNWSRRRARSARASCFPASGPAGGCSPSAATGSTAASTARSTTELDAVAAVTLDESDGRAWRSIRSPAPPP